jgi:DNA-binding response OmpR family regulator
MNMPLQNLNIHSEIGFGGIHMQKKILIIDDDENICELLRLYLKKEGYTLFVAHDGSHGLSLYKKEHPDLILLDIMLPQINGLEVLKLIRAHSYIPILMITAKDSRDEKIYGLDSGADDYIVKPFDPNEVVARIRAHLRKAEALVQEKPSRSVPLSIPNLLLDLEKYEVYYKDEPLVLTPKEFQLLHYLLINKAIVLTREQLLEKVWGYEFIGETRTVDVHIKNLREKFVGETCWQIKTIYGVGYKLEVK